MKGQPLTPRKFALGMMAVLIFLMAAATWQSLTAREVHTAQVPILYAGCLTCYIALSVLVLKSRIGWRPRLRMLAIVLGSLAAIPLVLSFLPQYHFLYKGPYWIPIQGSVVFFGMIAGALRED